MVDHRTYLASLALVAACGCSEGERPDPGNRESAPATGTSTGAPAASTPRPLREYFPLTPGDRWRIGATPPNVRHNLGVTGLDQGSIAVVHGTGHATAERYLATDREVALVDPTGQVLVPLLRAPLSQGAEWSYELTEREVRVGCEARVTSTTATRTVAGASLSECVEVERQCRYPAGEPFDVETRHQTTELYCPGVGKVYERSRFSPRPPITAIPEEREESVVAYQVAGAPPRGPTGSFDCSAFLLLPSDVAAACGPRLTPRQPVSGESLPEGCRHSYRSRDGNLVITAQRGDDEPGATSNPVSGQVQLQLTEGAVTIRVEANPAACSEEAARRLLPLLRSLIR